MCRQREETGLRHQAAGDVLAAGVVAHEQPSQNGRGYPHAYPHPHLVRNRRGKANRAQRRRVLRIDRFLAKQQRVLLHNPLRRMSLCLLTHPFHARHCRSVRRISVQVLPRRNALAYDAYIGVAL